MAELPNHNTEDLTVYQMVLNRLPFLVDNTGNKKLLSHFTLEVMNELEPCFRVRFNPDTNAEQFTRVGDEQFYSVLQRSVVADIVSMYIVLLKATETSAGDADTGVTASPTFMSKVKAGSVEVEYDQFKLKDSTLMAIETEALLSTFKKNAIRKAGQLGCVIDICDDCSINLLETAMHTTNIPALRVSSWNSDCGCGD